MAALAGSLLVVATRAARADVTGLSPTPCVNRQATAWRQVRDVVLDSRSLQYCTGNDCWSYDLATRMVTASSRRVPLVPSPPSDPPGVLTDGNGSLLATADDMHVEFCPEGATSKSPCSTFALNVSTPAVAVYPQMNDAHTLCAVI